MTKKNKLKVKQKTIAELFNTKSYFHVPQYQREYIWGKREWENLYNDIMDNASYFVGSIILVNNDKTKSYEIIDGQQRLTTLSLLFAAIYNLLGGQGHTRIKNKLTMINDQNKRCAKLELQSQGKNLYDYQYLLDREKITDDQPYDQPDYFGVRRISKAFEYFKERLKAEGQPLREISKKIEQVLFAEIIVNTHSDAYMMFESLNNRGMPLSAIDLIKNNLIAVVDTQNEAQVDSVYQKWSEMIKALTDSYTIQERFFRQYFNAFKNQLKTNFQTDNLPSRATRTTLIEIYEKLINSDYTKLLDGLADAANIYHKFVSDDDNDDSTDNRQDIYRNLDHVQAAPALMLMLYVEFNRNQLGLTKEDIETIAHNLTCFFVRRNLTDVPATNKLPEMFMDIIQEIEKNPQYNACKIITQQLKEKQADEQLFVKKLHGPIYDENAGITRFILCRIEEKKRPKNEQTDLWKKKINKKTDDARYIITIEHILPQDNNISNDWVQMIADGDRQQAKKYHNDYVHTLGNLTLTGYNSKLSTMSFERKKNRYDDKEKQYIGYKNGMYLNSEIVKKDQWTITDIKARTERLIKEVQKIFTMK